LVKLFTNAVVATKFELSDEGWVTAVKLPTTTKLPPMRLLPATNKLVLIEASPTETVKPAPAVIKPLACIVLLDNVSVPSRVANVRVPVGNVNVPLLDMAEITGKVSVLLERVSVVARPTKVSVDEGRVKLPVPFTIVDIIGAVMVLLDNVSEPSRVAKVRVPVGRVNVPLLDMAVIIGIVRVLFENVSVPSSVANVRVPVGKVNVPLLDIVEITGAERVLL